MSATARENLQRTVWCTGFWKVSGNTKRSLSHYLEYIPATCRLIRGGRLVVFHDDPEVLRYFEARAKPFSVQVEGRRMPLEDLPLYPQSARLLAGCAAMDIETLAAGERAWLEKGVNHFQREYRGSGDDAYRRIITIWMSKIALVDELARTDQSGATWFGWLDASVGRFNGRRANWDFTRVAYEAGRVHHYGNKMLYQGQPLPINASCLIAAAQDWARLNRRFQTALDAQLDLPYAHDEETILSHVHREDPQLFQLLGQVYSGRMARVHRLPHVLRHRVERWLHRRGSITGSRIMDTNPS